MSRFFKLSIFHLSALATSTVLGLIVGAMFVFVANPHRAWDALIAGFLWVMLVSAAMSIARFMRERIQRGEWRRCLALGMEMTFPATTLYILAVALVSAGAAETTILAGTEIPRRPDLLTLAPVFYLATLALALFVGPAFMLTSPFGKQQQPVPVRAEEQRS